MILPDNLQSHPAIRSIAFAIATESVNSLAYEMDRENIRPGEPWRLYVSELRIRSEASLLSNLARPVSRDALVRLCIHRETERETRGFAALYEPYMPAFKRAILTMESRVNVEWNAIRDDIPALYAAVVAELERE